MALPAILAAATAVGGLLGKLGKGRADGRVAEADINSQRDQLATNQYGMQQGSILRAAENVANLNVTDAQMGLQAPSMRAKQALLGDQLAGFQWKPPTHARANVVDFGSPFNISANTRELGGMLSSGALADQKQGNSPLQKVDFMSHLIQPPGQTPLPKSGWLDKILNTAGVVGGLAGAGGMTMNALGKPGWEMFAPEVEESEAKKLARNGSTVNPPRPGSYSLGGG